MKNRPLCMLCLLFVAVQLLRTVFSMAGEQDSPALRILSEGEKHVSVDGTISKAEEKENTVAVYLENCTVNIENQNFDQSVVLVYFRPQIIEQKLNMGNRIRVTGEASLFDEARNPGNFDQKSYYIARDIYISVWGERADLLSEEISFPDQQLYRLRTAWKKVLVDHMGDYYGNTMSAILLGEKGTLDRDMKRMCQKSGIGHILAVSGLHMSFIGLGLYRLMRKIRLPLFLSGAVSAAVLSLYAWMIGGGVSGTRALIMFLIRMGAEVTGRDYDLATSVAAAGAVQCALRPQYLYDAGFQLSYGAIWGIALFARPLKEIIAALTKSSEKSDRNERRNLIQRKIADSVSSSLAVNAALMGPVLYFYFEFPPYSIILNLFVIPVMPVLMGAGILGSVVSLFCIPAADLILGICRVVLWSYDAGCSISRMLPGSRYVTGRPSLVLLALYYMILLGICLWYSRFVKQALLTEKNPGKDRMKSTAGLLLICTAVLMPVICRIGYESRGELRVVMLDVGQGDGILIRTEEGKNYFVDGGSSDISSPGTYRIEPYLLSQGIAELDAVFLSHGDEDHINGIREMIGQQDTGVKIESLVLLPEEYRDDSLTELAAEADGCGVHVTEIRAGENVQSGETELVCIAPSGKFEETPGGNAVSMVLRLKYRKFTMLFTGDLEGEGEEKLIQSGQAGTCTVLKAAHHGSGSSGNEEFLSQTVPEVALISAGINNQYGHPAQETIERLRKYGASVYSTQQCGAIQIWTDGSRVKITSFK